MNPQQNTGQKPRTGTKDNKKNKLKKMNPLFLVAIPEVKMAVKTLCSGELVNTSEIKAALSIQHGRSFYLQLSQL